MVYYNCSRCRKIFKVNFVLIYLFFTPLLLMAVWCADAVIMCRPTKSHAFGLCLTLTRTSTIFSSIGARPGKTYKLTTMLVCTKNAIYNVCTIFRLHAVYQNHHKQSTIFQIAHAFPLPAGSAKIRQSAKRLLRTSFSRFV